MKRKMLFVVVFIFITHLGYSQKGKNWKDNSVGLTIYTPINLTGADKFYNDDWLLYGRQERTYTKYAVGLELRRHISEHVSFKLWGGFSVRNIDEDYYEKFPSPFIPETDYPTIVSESFEYDQTSFNISPGISFSTEIKKFEFSTGFELSYLHTGSGNQTYSAWVTQYRDTTGKDSIYMLSNGAISSGNSYGIGAFLGAEYNIFDNLSVGTEFHAFLFYSVFNGTTDFDDYQYALFNGTSEGLTYKNNIQRKEDFKQFSFTTVLPVIDVRYKF